MVGYRVGSRCCVWRVPDGSVTLLGQPEDTGPVGRELGMGGGGGGQGKGYSLIELKYLSPKYYSCFLLLNSS